MIFYGVNIRDSYAVCANASRPGASSRSYRNSDAFGIIYKIVNNKIIVYVTHALDYVKLIVKPFPKFRRRVFTVSAVKAFFAHTLKIFNIVAPVRGVECRKLCVSEFKCNIASVSNFLRIVKGFRNCRENAAHFFFGFYIKLVRFKSHIVRLVNGVVCSYANKYILHFCIVFINVMAVVCCHKRNSGFV